MAGNGPPRTPTAILKARGSWLADTRKDEPQPELGGPYRPEWLQGEALAEWNRQIKGLHKMRVLSKNDGAVLAAYCEAWAEFCGLVVKMKRMPMKAAIASGTLKAKNAACERMLKLAIQFGFTPAARTRLRSEPEKPAAKGKDRFFGSTG